jgi:hypothetical protein
MARIRNQKLCRRIFFAACCVALAFIVSACAAGNRPADPSRPRASEQPYPVTLAASEERSARALSTWKTVAGRSATTAPEFRPVTATLRALPSGLAAPLRLPQVTITGGEEQADEETRESLRRFIADAAPMLGVELRDLSLVEIVDEPGGIKRARYRQNPFGLPLRNGYGTLEIAFTPDLHVTELSSTAIPDSEGLRRAVAAVRQQVRAEQATNSLASRAITYTDATGTAQTRTPSAADKVAARELVVFPRLRTDDPATLELHLAWEISVSGQGSPLFVYVDAVTGEQLAAAQTSAPDAAVAP